MKINGKVHCFFEQKSLFDSDYMSDLISCNGAKNIKKSVLNNKKHIKK